MQPQPPQVDLILFLLNIRIAVYRVYGQWVNLLVKIGIAHGKLKKKCFVGMAKIGFVIV